MAPTRQCTNPACSRTMRRAAGLCAPAHFAICVGSGAIQERQWRCLLCTGHTPWDVVSCSSTWCGGTRDRSREATAAEVDEVSRRTMANVTAQGQDGWIASAPELKAQGINHGGAPFFRGGGAALCPLCPPPPPMMGSGAHFQGGGRAAPDSAAEQQWWDLGGQKRGCSRSAGHARDSGSRTHGGEIAGGIRWRE